jgi:hypothetical protein
MIYQERIDELASFREDAQGWSEPNWPALIHNRIAQLIALRDAEYPRDFPPATLVARQMGPLFTGQVIEPTDADKERGAHIHGAGSHLGIKVLVQWRSHRSWEYTKDLRTVT